MTKDYLSSVQQDGLAIQFVPEAMKTLDVCMAAVQQNGLVLEFVPEAMKTLDVCMAAVQQCWRSLQYVPNTPYYDYMRCMIELNK